MAVKMQTLGPNSLIFTFSSGVLPAPNAGGWVLPLFTTDISHERTQQI